MLISKETDVVLNGSNIKRYKELGYQIPIYIDKRNREKIKNGTVIKVKVEDLSSSNRSNVEIKCDYCGKVFLKVYQDYFLRKKKSIIKKDACQDCSHIKSKDSIFEKYGIDNIMENKEIREKIKQTNIERYGSDVYMKTDEFKNKSKATKILKYGTDNVQSLPKVKNKIRNSQNFKIDYISLKFSENNFKLISNIYLNNETTLKYICLKHEKEGIQETTYSKLQVYGVGECKYCLAERMRGFFQHDYKFVFKCFEDKGLELLSKEYINEITPLKYRCKKHNSIHQITFSSLLYQNSGCPECGLENRSLEKHYNWKGGITPIFKYLRERIVQWKKDSMRNCNYKCIITGEKFEVIHHLYGFDLIFQELMSENDVDIHDNITKYTKEELDLLEDKLLELHNKYPLGVCLTKEVHKLFHSNYGYGKNTPEQFVEFKQKYQNGEFKNQLEIIKTS